MSSDYHLLEGVGSRVYLSWLGKRSVDRQLSWGADARSHQLSEGNAHCQLVLGIEKSVEMVMIRVTAALLVLLLVLIQECVGSRANSVVKPRPSSKQTHPFKYKPDYKDWLGLKGHQQSF